MSTGWIFVEKNLSVEWFRKWPCSLYEVGYAGYHSRNSGSFPLRLEDTQRSHMSRHGLADQYSAYPQPAPVLRIGFHLTGSFLQSTTKRRSDPSPATLIISFIRLEDRRPPIDPPPSHSILPINRPGRNTESAGTSRGSGECQTAQSTMMSKPGTSRNRVDLSRAHGILQPRKIHSQFVSQCQRSKDIILQFRGLHMSHTVQQTKFMIAFESPIRGLCERELPEEKSNRVNGQRGVAGSPALSTWSFKSWEKASIVASGPTLMECFPQTISSFGLRHIS